eukprot:359869-Chlamydomonas_euryale.AAC.6
MQAWGACKGCGVAVCDVTGRPTRISPLQAPPCINQSFGSVGHVLVQLYVMGVHVGACRGKVEREGAKRGCKGDAFAQPREIRRRPFSIALCIAN